MQCESQKTCPRILHDTFLFPAPHFIRIFYTSFPAPDRWGRSLSDSLLFSFSLFWSPLPQSCSHISTSAQQYQIGWLALHHTQFEPIYQHYLLAQYLEWCLLPHWQWKHLSGRAHWSKSTFPHWAFQLWLHSPLIWWFASFCNSLKSIWCFLAPFSLNFYYFRISQLSRPPKLIQIYLIFLKVDISLIVC